MIENDRQYIITQEQLATFRVVLHAFDDKSIPTAVEPLLHAAQHEALLRVIEELTEGIARYEERQG